MRARAITRFLSIVPTVVVLACSPSTVAVSNETGDGDSGSSTTKACVDRAYAFCTHLSSCSQTDLQTRYGDSATCEGSEQIACENALTKPSSGATPTTAEGCVAAIPQWSCDDFLRSENTPPACGVAAGALPVGAACAVNPQCQSTWCSFAGYAGCGTCATPPSAGDPCQSGICPSSLSCQKSICVSFVDEGSSCGASAPCAADLTCVAGICQKGVETLGAPCSFAGAGCDPDLGLACNALSSTCVTAVIAKPGAACGIVANQNVLCSEGTCVRGTCSAFVPRGGACETNGAASCGPGTRCVVTVDGGANGTCQVSGFASCP